MRCGRGPRAENARLLKVERELRSEREISRRIDDGVPRRIDDGVPRRIDDGVPRRIDDGVL
ncbi:hypothetical protein ABZ871_25005 [Streptomyces populi]